ncbi:MAG: type II CRISPR RNA-guided endonuclease Cas9 [Acidimicrobiia bacterium]|nr:type II CRISPR RNA-guided endonuclease Cas9 [Acidimicrobiia bacterium]MYC58250.1 type II CRISPR RNA-guided endonuclease Cas9 [Acidimicrobiia bacterium]MYG94418.1 type II CRISPR RNA-guided endonuclease Cas9 [Acidimicrobiia bacterium]MYI30060.1 type II CRISPR RNA-guided endonuclease Cas9 [Acidimicrobiia bacterium]
MLRLGLDLGTNSIGWVLYRLVDGEPVELVDGGVLIHSDGRNPKNRASNAADRRSKRGPRRNRDRMLCRQHRVAGLLHDLGLLPQDEEARAVLRNLDPLQLRAEALDRPLNPYELGRVLLSFADRRGFKSNRKTDGGEDGAIRKDVSELRRRIEQSGARTLGEYLWRRHRDGKTIRARLGNGLYPDRAMVEDELEAIHKAQIWHHSELKPDDWDSVIKTLLFQRRLRPVERGHCTLMPEEKRAYKAYPFFQLFRILQEVMNIEVAPSGDGFRPLGVEERERVVDKLLSSKSRTFEQIVVDAKLPEGTRVNLRSIAREKLDGDLTASALSSGKCFGKKWQQLSLERQQEVVERLIEVEDSWELEDWLQDEFDLSEEAAEAVAAARLPQGTGNLSLAAIEKLLPHMQQGQRYHDAVIDAGLGHHSDLRGDGGMARLPYYGKVLARHVLGGRPDGRSDQERYGRIANPTVHIALGQVRHLFNAIVGRYGKPDEVVIELSRELKQSDAQRSDYERRQAKDRERNDRLRELAETAGHPEPSGQDMRKLRLWEEQGPVNGRVCPFTGRTISVEMVLSDATEIEHLLPYSRSLDDSMNNKVVAMRDANREKGNCTPFEAWGHDSERYEALLARVRLLPKEKQWRFNDDAIDNWEKEGRFLDRQLNENSYLSRVAREYLEAVVPPECIWVTPGRMTAMLRRRFGLNGILSDESNGSKNRDDHRHHLIDAVVIGLTSRSQLQRVARATGRGDDGDSILETLELPWAGFRADLESLVQCCVVRHRPDHFQPSHGGTTGSLHNETAYGIVDGPDEKDRMTLVETKPLDSLAPEKLDAVRDPALRDRLKALWELVDMECEGESRGVAWQTFVDRAWAEFRVRRVRVLTILGKDSLAFIRDETGRVYKTYKTDGNAYMDVWLLPSGRTKGETVSRFDAHQPDFRSQVKDEHPTAKKLMRLHINDMVAVGEGSERRIMRVKELSGQRIVAVDHTAAGKAKELRSEKILNKSAGQVLQAGLRKVSVDVLGRVHDGGPFSRDLQGKDRRQ